MNGPHAGQRWRHPEFGYGFVPGTATLERRAGGGLRVGESIHDISSIVGWDYDGDDGSAGWIPEAELVSRGEPLTD